MSEEPGWSPPLRRRIDDLLRAFVARADELLHTQDQMNGLLSAVVSLAEDLSLEAVLDRVVQSACELVGARYGALGVIGEDQQLRHFITVGIGEEEIRLIGDLPTGHGVLGHLIREPPPLRLHDLSAVLIRAQHPGDADNLDLVAEAALKVSDSALAVIAVPAADGLLRCRTAIGVQRLRAGQELAVPGIARTVM